MSIETLQARYPVFTDGEFKNRTLRETVSLRKEKKPISIWSARLSTGIFGLTNCRSGNSPHAPKGESEVALGLGDEALHEFIKLGFLPCPVCHPENVSGFWDAASDSILRYYPNLSNPTKFLDRSVIPFDSRRVNWEKLAPFLSNMPNRLYVPAGLDDRDLGVIKARFPRLGFDLPPVGFYDTNSPTRFTEYNIA